MGRRHPAGAVHLRGPADRRLRALIGEIEPEVAADFADDPQIRIELVIEDGGARPLQFVGNEGWRAYMRHEPSSDPRARRFVRRLAAHFPQIGAIVALHVATYDALLAHVAFGEITRWADDRARHDPADSEVRRLVSALEAEYVLADEPAQNVIARSLAELDLPGGEL